MTKKKFANKEHITKRVAQRLDKHNIEVKKVIESIFEVIISELRKGKPVRIVGFGGFEIHNRKERVGRNPQTGEKIHIPATKTPYFSPGKRLREAVKNS